MEGNDDVAVENETELHQQQLQEIEQLLLASPDDPSLLALKADLLELIAVTTTTTTVEPNLVTTNVAPELDSQNDIGVNDTGDVHISRWSATKDSGKPANNSKRPLPEEEEDDETRKQVASFSHDNDDEKDDAVGTPKQGSEKKKKSEFQGGECVVPSHLIVKEGDSKAEINRKKRAVKALKSQWRSRQKEMEADRKQRSWQNFQKRKKIPSTSIFSTDEDAKVGVVGGRNLTEFPPRKTNK